MIRRCNTGSVGVRCFFAAAAAAASRIFLASRLRFLASCLRPFLAAGRGGCAGAAASFATCVFVVLLFGLLFGQGIRLEGHFHVGNLVRVVSGVACRAMHVSTHRAHS